MTSAAGRAAVLIAAVLAAAAGAVALAWGGYQVPPDVLAPSIVVDTAVGWSFIGVGVVAARVSPDSRTGLLMVLLGFAWFARMVVAFDTDVAFVLGVIVGSVYLSILVHLLVSYPTGRLDSWPQRLIVGVAYLLGAPLDMFFLVVFGAQRQRGDGPPPNGIVLLESSGEFQPDVISLVVQGVVVVLCLAVIAETVIRWRRWPPPQRRRTAPAVLSGVVITAAILLSRTALLLLLPSRAGVIFAWAAQLVLVMWPAALLVGLLRTQLDRAAIGRLMIELGSGVPVPDRLRTAMASALHDPSVQIGYWLPDQQRHVDSRGRPVALTAADGRAVTSIERDGRRIAALSHDATVDRALVTTVAAAAALALENERLDAELTAQLHEVRRSRSRIVEEADAARRRVERDLHDGSQQRLLSVALALKLARSELDSDPVEFAALIGEARAELDAAIDELAALARGIYPAVLTDDGLGPALEALAARAPLPVILEGSLGTRLPPSVEQAAYFVASEAIANAGKHADASMLTVRLRRSGASVALEIDDDGRGGATLAGSGLRGLSDRVSAVGGRFSVVSPAGGGTRVSAEMPCR